MTSLLFLTDDDFERKRGPKKAEMILKGVNGISLVLFYSKLCTHCHSFIPIFNQLPNDIKGCQFGLVNISNNKNLVQMSKGTVCEIKYVPYVIMFMQGRPFMRYDGERTMTGVKKFVSEVMTSVSKKEFNLRNNNLKKDHRIEKRPAYCIGDPKCDEDVCYLDYNNAYTKAK